MNLNKLYEKYITKEAIVDMFTRYELYYQISLGSYIFETIQDIDESIKKINELNLKPSSNKILSSYIEIILHFANKDELGNNLEYHIRSRALLHSLKDFVNNDKELLNPMEYVKQKNDDITHDKVFSEQMMLQLESEYSRVHDEFEFLVNDQLVDALKYNLNYT
ncbi:MAG: hypothetical protein U9Q33_12895 [Campylobacterota bacterium]|nr:hypothetical protein [Campylobacterota bacterium]